MRKKKLVAVREKKIFEKSILIRKWPKFQYKDNLENNEHSVDEKSKKKKDVFIKTKLYC